MIVVFLESCNDDIEWLRVYFQETFFLQEPTEPTCTSPMQLRYLRKIPMRVGLWTLNCAFTASGERRLPTFIE